MRYTADGKNLFFFEKEHKFCCCKDEARHYSYNLKEITKLYKFIYKETPQHVYRKRLGYDRYRIEYSDKEFDRPKLVREGLSIFTFEP